MQDNIEIKDGDKWEFNEAVTSVFSEMLERSIPDYENMRALCFDIGSHFVKPKTFIIDCGCSNGEAIAPFVRRFGAQNQYKLLDVSGPMLDKCRERYKGLIDCGIVEVKNHDLRYGVAPTDSASLVLGILTIQFTPIEYRHKIIQSIYDSLKYGGCFIFVEKLLGNSSTIDEIFVEEYYKMKAENQYTQEQIQSKRKSLEGVLVPITENWNKELLTQAGFRQIDCFWRKLNFAGFVCIK